MKKNKPGQGRKPLEPSLKKIKLIAWTSQGFKEKFQIWCARNQKSQGEGVEFCCMKATDNFNDDIEDIE